MIIKHSVIIFNYLQLYLTLSIEPAKKFLKIQDTASENFREFSIHLTQPGKCGEQVFAQRVYLSLTRVSDFRVFVRKPRPSVKCNCRHGSEISINSICIYPSVSWLSETSVTRSRSLFFPWLFRDSAAQQDLIGGPGFRQMFLSKRTHRFGQTKMLAFSFFRRSRFDLAWFQCQLCSSLLYLANRAGRRRMEEEEEEEKEKTGK